MAKRKGDDSKPSKSKGAGGKADAPKDGEGGEYEFEMPEFDEQKFIRREVQSGKITFVTVGIAAGIGVLAYLADQFGGNYRLGWLPILAGMALLAPFLKKLGFSGDVVENRAMAGNWFLLFFTALGVWVLAYNLPF